MSTNPLNGPIGAIFVNFRYNLRVVKAFIEKHYNIIFLLFLVAIGSLSYFLGVEQGRKEGGRGIVFSCSNTTLKKQVISEQTIKSDFVQKENIVPQVQGVSTETKGMYVGSKNGTKYYTPGCSGTSRIKPENYIWFQSAEDATLQGYSKGSC